jgi:MFS family permease
MSYVYEIIGRKLTLFLSFATTSVVFYALPYTAPSYSWLIVARCMIGVTMSAPLCHPLVPDYI